MINNLLPVCLVLVFVVCSYIKYIAQVKYRPTNKVSRLYKAPDLIPVKFFYFKKIVEIYISLVAIDKHVIFTRISSHIGIHWKTVVDQEAKNALDDLVSNCCIPYTDFKPLIMKYIIKRWQEGWDQHIYNKLHEMHSVVGNTSCSYGKNRKEQVVLPKCRIGHSGITHSYLLNNEEQPECIPCNSNYSLTHALLDCMDVSDICLTFYNVSYIVDVFRKAAGDTIL